MHADNFFSSTLVICYISHLLRSISLTRQVYLSYVGRKWLFYPLTLYILNNTIYDNISHIIISLITTLKDTVKLESLQLSQQLSCLCKSRIIGYSSLNLPELNDKYLFHQSYSFCTQHSKMKIGHGHAS